MEKSKLGTLWACKPVHPLWQTVWSFLNRLEIESSYDSAIPFLDNTPRK